MPITADILTNVLKSVPGAFGYTRPASLEQIAADMNSFLRTAGQSLTSDGAAIACAQVTQESWCLSRTEEKLSIYPSSWAKYKGRTFIGITFEAGYRGISQYLGMPEYFVNNPKDLALYKYAFKGPEYFFKTESGLWAAANAGNNFAVSQWINGGKGRVGGTATQCAAFKNGVFRPLGWFADDKKRTGIGPRQIWFNAYRKYGAQLLQLWPIPFPLPTGEYYGYDDGTTKSHSGARSADVAAIKMIQAKVGASQDGRYGLQTKSAVLKWQASKRLLTDGRVGPITWTSFGFTK